MVNNVMCAQAAVPAKLKIETVQHMVKSAVDNEAQKYSGQDTQYVMRLHESRAHVPKATKYGRHHEPWHGNQSFR